MSGLKVDKRESTYLSLEKFNLVLWEFSEEGEG